MHNHLPVRMTPEQIDRWNLEHFKALARRRGQHLTTLYTIAVGVVIGLAAGHFWWF